MKAQTIGVIGLISDDDGAAGEICQERLGAGQVMRLSRGNQYLDRPALTVDPRVDFCGGSAAASPHTAICTVFLTPEAC